MKSACFPPVIFVALLSVCASAVGEEFGACPQEIDSPPPRETADPADLEDFDIAGPPGVSWRLSQKLRTITHQFSRPSAGGGHREFDLKTGVIVEAWSTVGGQGKYEFTPRFDGRYPGILKRFADSLESAANTHTTPFSTEREAATATVEYLRKLHATYPKVEHDERLDVARPGAMLRLQARSTAKKIEVAYVYVPGPIPMAPLSANPVWRRYLPQAYGSGNHRDSDLVDVPDLARVTMESVGNDTFRVSLPVDTTAATGRRPAEFVYVLVASDGDGRSTTLARAGSLESPFSTSIELDGNLADRLRADAAESLPKNLDDALRLISAQQEAMRLNRGAQDALKMEKLDIGYRLALNSLSRNWSLDAEILVRRFLAETPPILFRYDTAYELKSVDLSETGEFVAACGEKQVDVFEVRSGKCLATISIPGGVLGAAVSADGRSVTAVERQRIATWNLGSRPEIVAETQADQIILDFDFDAKAKRVAAATEDKLYVVENGKRIASWKINEAHEALLGVRLSRNGEFAAVLSGPQPSVEMAKQTVSVWKVSEGRVIHRYHTEGKKIWSPADSGNSIVVSTTHSTHGAARGHGGTYIGVHVSWINLGDAPSIERSAVYEGDERSFLLDLDGDLVAVQRFLNPYVGNVHLGTDSRHSVAVLPPNSDQVMLREQAGMFADWSDNHLCVRTLHPHPPFLNALTRRQIHQIAENPQGNRMAILDESGRVTVVEYPGGRVIGDLPTEDSVASIRFDAQGELLATDKDNTDVRWNLGDDPFRQVSKQSRVIEIAPFELGPFRRYDPSGRRIAMSHREAIEIAEATKGRKVVVAENRSPHPMAGVVRDSAFSDDGTLFITAGYQFLSIWNCDTGHELTRIPEMKYPTHQMSDPWITKDGKYVVYGGGVWALSRQALIEEAQRRFDW
jgi:WD40 repeat protein